MAMTRCVSSLLLSTMFLLSSLPVTAQNLLPVGMERAGRWDLSIGAVLQGSNSLNGQYGSSLKLDSVPGFMIAFDYNFNNHLAVGFSMDFLSPKYEAVVNTENDGLKTVSHRADMFTGQFRGIWNFLEGAFTPYVAANLGWTYVDSNWSSEPPTVGCWWDPWWGYVCAEYWNTHSDTSFSFGGGVGLRWDISNVMFLRGSYNVLRPQWKADAEKPVLSQGRFELGWRF